MLEVAARDAKDDIGVHLNETAVRVVSEACAVALLGESPSAVRSFSPRLRIVSIIPGIETGAPERTETSSGFAGSPSRLPVASSSRARLPSTSRAQPVGVLAVAQKRRCTRAHAIVKPGGTGTPRFVISARLAPLPPSTLCHVARAFGGAVAEKENGLRHAASAAAAEAKLLRVGGGGVG